MQIAIGITFPRPAIIGGRTIADLPSIMGWYDASDPNNYAETAGAVSDWYDLSGAGNHLANTAAGGNPTALTRQIGTLYGFDFQGTGGFGDVLERAISSTAQPFTMMWVEKSDDATNVRIPVGLATSGSDNYFGGTGANQFTGAMGAAFNVSTTRNTSAHIMCWIVNGASSVLYIDGGAAKGTGNVGTNNATAIRIGLRPNGFQGFDGIIGEYMIANAIWDAADINFAGDYLSRWGVSWADVS